jgi:hypothetical protein
MTMYLFGVGVCCLLKLQVPQVHVAFCHLFVHTNESCVVSMRSFNHICLVCTTAKMLAVLLCSTVRLLDIAAFSFGLGASFVFVSSLSLSLSLSRLDDHFFRVRTKGDSSFNVNYFSTTPAAFSDDEHVVIFSVFQLVRPMKIVCFQLFDCRSENLFVSCKQSAPVRGFTWAGDVVFCFNHLFV